MHGRVFGVAFSSGSGSVHSAWIRGEARGWRPQVPHDPALPRMPATTGGSGSAPSGALEVDIVDPTRQVHVRWTAVSNPCGGRTALPAACNCRHGVAFHLLT